MVLDSLCAWMTGLKMASCFQIALLVALGLVEEAVAKLQLAVA
jgi:hypothetical protein